MRDSAKTPVGEGSSGKHASRRHDRNLSGNKSWEGLNEVEE